MRQWKRMLPTQALASLFVATPISSSIDLMIPATSDAPFFWRKVIGEATTKKRLRINPIRKT